MEEVYNQLIYVQAHCDNRTLHSPGVCKYCDKYPEAQELRKQLGVRFSDELIVDERIPCPAMAARSFDHLNAWGGNQPHGPAITEEQKEYFRSIETFGSKVMYGEDHLDTF